MKRTQAESGGRNSRAHNNCYRLTTIPQGGGRGVRSEAVKLHLGRSGEGRWRFTVFDFVSHYAILIGNKLKSLAHDGNWQALFPSFSTHEVSLFFPNQLRCWGERGAGWAHPTPVIHRVGHQVQKALWRGQLC